MSETLTHSGAIWFWQGHSVGGWHFLTLDCDAAEEIAAHEAMRRLELGSKRGFGSIKVRAQVGETRWDTSLFPWVEPRKLKCWLLPLKKTVRSAEGLAEGGAVTVRLELM